MHIRRNFTEPHRGDLPWAERWEGADGGLIACWERGREKRKEDPELALRASAGELVVLPWRGGVEKAIKGEKYGTLNYLAMYQGIRGESLDIDTSVEVVRQCAKTRVVVTYTYDTSKFASVEE